VTGRRIGGSRRFEGLSFCWLVRRTILLHIGSRREWNWDCKCGCISLLKCIVVTQSCCGNEAALPTREVESYEARDISPHLGVDGTPHIIARYKLVGWTGGRTIRQADWLVIFRSSFISTISFSPELQFSILLQVTTFSSVPIQDIPCNHVNPIIHA
jgi:hypothetical protein